jgi:uncharacterized membrane protein YkvA (DUF1232 family)
MSKQNPGFGKHYSEKGFWQKVRDNAKKAGKEVIEKALWLYYALQKPETPLWAKTAIIGALGYFIFPLDALPDPMFADDFGVLTAAVALVAIYIDDDVKAKTAQKMKEWFGDDQADKTTA